MIDKARDSASFLLKRRKSLEPFFLTDVSEYLISIKASKLFVHGSGGDYRGFTVARNQS